MDRKHVTLGVTYQKNHPMPSIMMCDIIKKAEPVNNSQKQERKLEVATEVVCFADFCSPLRTPRTVSA